jgi:hypothetical protein
MREVKVCCTKLSQFSRAEQSRAEQSRAEQSRAEQSRAEQSRAELKFQSFSVKTGKRFCKNQ